MGTITINADAGTTAEPKDQVTQYTIYKNGNCANNYDPNATEGVSDGNGNFYVPSTVYAYRTQTQVNNTNFILDSGDVFYTSNAMTTPFDGAGDVYSTSSNQTISNDPAIQVVTVSASGVITVQSIC